VSRSRGRFVGEIDSSSPSSMPPTSMIIGCTIIDGSTSTDAIAASADTSATPLSVLSNSPPSSLAPFSILAVVGGGSAFTWFTPVTVPSCMIAEGEPAPPQHQFGSRCASRVRSLGTHNKYSRKRSKQRPCQWQGHRGTLGMLTNNVAFGTECVRQARENDKNRHRRAPVRDDLAIVIGESSTTLRARAKSYVRFAASIDLSNCRRERYTWSW
jgi:hypothetical protein